VPDHEAELVLQLLAARAGTILASAESRERLTARDEFVAVAAHQLRTPLTVLRLELHAMERGLRTSGPNGTRLEQARQALERATRQCDRVQRIGEHLLDLLELRTPHLALQRSLTDLGELARAVAARLVDELAHARCGLVMNIQPGAVGAWDRARLEQVVSALLMNTAKHAPGSRVELSVQANDSAAMLSVRDEGQGITAEDAAHIFDRFERASSNDPVGGWGLGLFLCRRVVEAHGGTIRVLSSPGAGATFVVELPRGAPLDLRALRAHDAMPS
jgi:signal transduction histidine kinase